MQNQHKWDEGSVRSFTAISHVLLVSWTLPCLCKETPDLPKILHTGFLQVKRSDVSYSLNCTQWFCTSNLGQPLTFQTINVPQRHFLGNYSGRQHFFYLICYEMTSTVKPKVNHWLSLMTLKETGHVRKQLHFHFCCHRSFIAFDSNSTPRKELLTTSYFKF